ncbi:hypothetical protein Ocin01_18031 [Orchesella cincta]|uniref:DOMON domain-containing protein n=1 Tax=Orchesella cincta TaxID=48709 RepID=A0A1D2M6V7_ORCCI|nr:hypothetical protein Ocin01_18031 [Orchesella cincta]
MDFFLIFVLASSAFKVVEAQTCGEADTAKPPYPSLPPGAPVFMHFSDTDRRRSNVIASMFRESGVSRQCVTWEPPPDDKCAETMSCRSFACFGHQSDEPELDSRVEFAVEMYGYAENKGWVAVALSRNDSLPLINAIQIECLRDGEEIILQASYFDDAGVRNFIPTADYDTFLKQVDFIADSSPRLTNHLYCKVYLKRTVIISIGKDDDIFDSRRIDSTQFQLSDPITDWILLVDIAQLLHVPDQRPTHILYVLPMYPLMLVSWYLARCAHGDETGFVPTTSSSFYHGTAGVTCLQMFLLQGFLLLFSYGALLITSNKHCLLFAEDQSTLGSPIRFRSVEFFYHWIIRLFNYKDDGYFMPAQIPSISKAITQGTKEIQRQPNRHIQIWIWWAHNILCVITAAAMIFVIQPDIGDGFPDHSKDILPKFTWAGGVTWEWDYYWLFVG